MISNIAEGALSAAGSSAARSLTKSLRSYASAHGWPTHIVSHLHVEHEDGHFRARFPSQVESELMDLEFGTQNTPPSPALRRFENRMHGAADRAVMDALGKHLGGN